MAKEPTGEQGTAIEAEIFAGRKIQAIKLYREATGGDLKDAKDAVEAKDGELRQRSPEKFSAAQGKAGCMGVIVLAAGVIAAAAAGVWCTGYWT